MIFLHKIVKIINTNDILHSNIVNLNIHRCSSINIKIDTCIEIKYIVIIPRRNATYSVFCNLFIYNIPFKFERI